MSEAVKLLENVRQTANQAVDEGAKRRDNTQQRLQNALRS
jgi:hypothetical protein